jgi:hypothetical protein
MPERHGRRLHDPPTRAASHGPAPGRGWRFGSREGMSMADLGGGRPNSRYARDPAARRPNRRRTSGFLALEARVMYDGAAAATAASVDHHAADGASAASAAGVPVISEAAPPSAPQAHQPAPEVSADRASTQETAAAPPAESRMSPAGAGREVVFIDPQSADLMNLYAGVKDDALVFVLDPSRDGVQQIADILAAQDLGEFDAIHIVSHGLEAQVRLGTTILTGTNMGDHAAALADIGASLKADGDILLYGCDVASGADGARFIGEMARLTGADVAASTDTTGSADLGGDWTLEAMTGTIGASMPFTDAALSSYHGTLVVGFGSGPAADPFGDTGPFDARMLFGDFDNDGDVDVLYQNDNTAGAGIGYFRNDGGGGFTPFIDATAAGTPFAGFHFAGEQILGSTMFVVDYDNDGDVDVIDRDGTLGAWRNDGGTFSLQADPLGDTGSVDSRMLFGDFDKDGDVDVLYQNGTTAGAGIGYLKNNGGGTFTPFTDAMAAGTPFTGFNFSAQQILPSAMFVVDYDNDGDVDVVDREGSLGAWRNDNGTFSLQGDPLGDTGTFDQRLLFGDFDSDGDVDVLYQNGDTAGAGIGYFKNNGGGTFTQFADATVGTPFTGFNFAGQKINPAFPTPQFVVDVDADGDVDIIDRDTFGSLSVWVQGGTVGDGSPPTLASSAPADDATGVAPSADIVLTFDEAVTKGTGNIYIVRTSDNTVVQTIAVTSSQVTGSGTTWTINPNSDLAGATAYAVRIDSGAFVDTDAAVFFGIYDNTTLNFTTGLPNQPPAVANLNGDSVAFIEGGGAVPLDTGANATVTDGDSANFDGGNVTVSLTANGVAGEDVLGIQNQGVGAGQIGVAGANVTFAGTTIGTFAGGSGGSNLVITLDADATPAAVQALLRALTYSNTNTLDPSTASRTVAVTVADGDGGTSAAAAVTVNVTAVNDAPTLSATGTNPTFTEGGAAVDLFGGVAASTVEAGQTVTSLTLTVGNVTDGANEVLRFDGSDVQLTDGFTVASTATNGLAVSVNVTGGTATVSFSGAGLSAAALQALVDGLAYRNDSQNPTDAARTVTITRIVDSGGTSNGGDNDTTLSIASVVNVDPTNDAPTVSGLPASRAFVEDTAGNLDLSAASFADVDSGSLTVTLTAASGIMTLAPSGALTLGGSGTGTITLAGTAAAINAYLDTAGNIVYTPTSNFSGSASLTVTANDGDGSGTVSLGTVSLVVAAVNDAPDATAPGAHYNASEGVPLDLHGTGLSIADVDGAGGSETVTLSVGQGTIMVTAGNSGVSGISGNGTSSVSFSGTIAQLTALLGGGSTGTVVYLNNLANPSASTTLTLAVDDNGHTGGGDLTDTATATIDIAATNQPPVNTVPGALHVNEDAATAIVGISVADPDAGTAKVRVTLSVTHGILDVRSDVAGGLGSYGISGDTTGTVVLTGTISEINATLAAVGGLTYRPQLNYVGGDILTIVTSDLGHTGTPGALSDTDTVAITVNAVAGDTLSGYQTIELTGDADGDGVADPGETVTVTVGIANNSATTDALGVSLSEILAGLTLTGPINVSPVAMNDSYTAVGNTQLLVGGTAPSNPAVVVAGSVFGNDVEFFGDTFTFVSNTTTANGTLVLNADGTFTYTPNINYTGVDTFTYTVTDDGLDGVAGTGDDLTSTATVKITVSNKVWYVNNAAGTGGDGTSTNPFDSLADVTGAAGPDGAGDIIYVSTGSGNYTGGITLLNNQTLWGANEALVVGGHQLAAAGADPVITNAAGDGVTLAQGNTLKGFTVGDTTGFDITNTPTASVGTLTISNVELNGTGGLFRADSGGTLNVTFDSASTTSATDQGIHLAGGASGTFTVNGTGTISGIAGTDVLIGASSATVNIASNISSNAGGSIEVTGRTGASNVTFSGDLAVTGGFGIFVHDNSGTGTIAFTNADGDTQKVSTGSNPAVSLVNNSGLTISFTGGNLDIDVTTATTAFLASGGGIINVTGANNTITTTTGTALYLNGVTVGTSGIRFDNVSTNGAVNGILLTSVGQAAGSPGIDIGGGAIVNATSRGVDIDLTQADVTIAATISTTAAGRSVEVTNSGRNVAGGSQIVFSGAIDENGLGINLDNNDQNTQGAAITFSGGLDISTGANTGFTAVNGGTVNVTGTANTIATTTGTALNVVNTTIGASGLTFRSISANGGATGIVLNNTGTSGGLTVTGTGAANSGGIIQNTSANNDGISLVNTSNVSLNWMRIANTGGDGISGTSVHGFTLTNSTIFGTGDGDEENGIIFSGATDGSQSLGVDGSVLIQDVTIDGNNDGTQWGLRIFNNLDGATLNMNIQRLTIQNNIDTGGWVFGEDALSIDIYDGTANILIDDSDFLNTEGSGIHANAGDATEGEAALLNLTVQNSTFVNNHALPGGLSLTTSGDATARYKVTGNTITGTTIFGTGSEAIDFDASYSSHLDAIVSNNTMNVTYGTGVEFIANEAAVGRLLFDNNTINLDPGNINPLGQPGMDFQAREVTAGYTGAELDLTLLNNTITGITSTTFGFQGMNFATGSSVAPPDGQHNVTIKLNMSGNSVSGTAGLEAYSFRQRIGTTFQIQGLSGSSAAAVEAYIAAQNPAGNLGGNTIVAQAIGTTIEAYSSGTTPTPTTPTLPPAPLLAATGGVEAASPSDPVGATDPAGTPDAGEQTPTSTDPLPPSVPTDTVYVDDGVLSRAELDATVEAAIARWAEAGLSAEQIAHLRSITFTLADMPGFYLGSAAAGTVTIDADAAGQGWYVDATPLVDGEFSHVVGGALYTLPGEAPAGRLDLLTTVMHELGHHLGLGDTYAPSDQGSVMYGYLVTGQRRLPGYGQAEGAVVGALAGTDYLFSPINIGALPAGRAITIQFEAVVDAQANGLITHATKDGQITSSNFAAVDTNQSVVTVDFLTLGDRVFNDLNFDGDYDAGTDTGIDGVALTLYVDSNHNNSFDAGIDTAITTTTTDNGGFYSFDGLAPGDYIVQVDQSNFNSGGALEGLSPSGATVDPDGDVDHDNSGMAVVGQGAVSGAITLDYDSETTDDGTGQNDVNTTLDFGFATNAPPLIDNAGGSVAFTEGGGPVAVDPNADITISDIDNVDIAGATVTISGGFVAGDVLTANVGATGITASYSAGVLTLSGIASKAAYAQVLNTITFDNGGDDPTAGGHTSRTLTWVVNDGSANSSPVTSTIDVTPINDAPTLTAIGTDPTFTEGGAAVDLFGVVVVSTVESGQAVTSLTLTVDNVTDGADEILGFDGSDVQLTDGFTVASTATNGLNVTVSVSGNTATVSFSGANLSAAALQALVDGLTYRNDSQNPTDAGRTVTITQIIDSGGTSNGGDADTALSIASTVNVDPVNDAPTVAPANNGVGYTEGAAGTVLNSAITLGDVDSSDLTGATITINDFVAGDTLGVTLGAGISIASNSGGVLVLTGNASVADYEAVLRTVTYSHAGDDPNLGGTDNTRNVSWQVTDDTGIVSNSATTQVGLTAVNDAPDADIAPSDYNAPPGVILDLKNSGLSISDPDSAGNAITVVLSVTEGTLTVTPGTTSTSVVGSGTSSVTITGTAAEINALLNGNATSTVSYVDNAATPAATVTLTLAVDDGGATGGGALADDDTAIINIDQPPVVGGVGDTVGFTENGGAVTIDADLTVDDPDAPNSGDQIHGATVTISAGAVLGDVLAAVTAGTNITAVFNGTDTLTLTGTDTLANYQAVLRSVTFTNTGENPTDSGASTSRTITWVVRDNYDVPSASTTSTVAVTAQNDAPTATITLPSYAATEQMVLDLKSTGLSVDDQDSGGNDVQVTLSVTQGRLNVTAGTSGVVVTGSGTASVTLTGAIAEINALLSSDPGSTVTYINNVDDPSAAATLTLAVADNGNTGGINETAQASATIDITQVNDGPSASAPAGYLTAEQTALDLKNSGLSIDDPDSAGTDITVTLSVTEGVLEVTAGGSGVVVANTGTSSVTLTGTVAEINALLTNDGTSTVRYINGSDTPSASVTLTIAVDDNGHTGTGGAKIAQDTATISITAVNDAPTATAPPSYLATEQAALDLKNNGLGVGDADSGNAIITVTLSVTEGVLTVTAGGSGAGVVGSGTSSVTLNGTAAQINALLTSDGSSTVSYIDNSDTPSASATLTLVIDDGGATGAGGPQTDIASTTIAITAVNDAPTGVPANNVVGYTEGGTAAALLPNFALADADNPASFDGGTVTASISDVFAGDFLAFLAGGPFTLSGNDVVYNGVTTIGSITAGAVGSPAFAVTLNANATLAVVEALLENVGYASTSDNPNDGGADNTRQVDITFDDGGNTGTGVGQANSTINVLLTAVNDAPTATVAPAGYTATEQTVLSLKNNGLTVADPDSAGADVTVILSVSEGTLDVAAGTSGVVVAGSGTSSVTLTGTVAEINALLTSDATSTVDYANGSDTPSASATLTLSIDDGGNTGGGSLTSQDAAVIAITAVNDAPTATITAPTYAATEQTALDLKNTGLSVGDVDALGGSVTVVLSVTEGVLNVTAGGSGAFVSGSGTPSVTITGTLAQINALLATDATSTVSYIDDSDTPGASATLTLAVDDNGNSGTPGARNGSDTATINITAVNDAPVNTVPGAQVVNEDTDLVLGGANTISIADADAGTATVTLSVLHGTLTLSQITGLTFGTGDGTADATMAFTGSIADINAALAGLVYRGNPNYNGGDTLSVTTSDNGGTGLGGVLTDTDTVAVTVVPVNDAPDLAPDVDLAFYNANVPGGVAVFPNITVTDVDSPTLTGATVVVAFGRQVSDTLHFTNQNGITGSYDPATGVLTLSGNASLAQYQTALRSITFSTNAQQPVGMRTFTFVVNDGSAQNALSDPSTTLMAVIGRVYHHHDSDAGFPGFGGGGHHDYGHSDRYITYDPRPFSFPQGYGQSSGIHFVHADAGFTISPDRSFEIALPLESIGAPLGGDIAILSVTLLDGSPLPSWLTFDAATGKLAGLPPNGLVASLEAEPTAGDVVTGALPPNAPINGAPQPGAQPETLTIRVVARDTQGNISIMTFTLVLRPASHGWNAPSRDFGGRDTAGTDGVVVLPADRTAWSLDRDAWTRAAASGSAAALMAALDNGVPATLAGRASLAQQLDRNGWRSMSADRTALLHSLRVGARTWQ